jgi:hypothetical protein
VPLRQGPGSGYPVAGHAQAFGKPIHFIGDQQATYGDHQLAINVDATLGGPVPNMENWGAPPKDGDNAVSDVSWENLSDNCVP